VPGQLWIAGCIDRQKIKKYKNNWGNNAQTTSG
jgi:hypothetical protein